MSRIMANLPASHIENSEAMTIFDLHDAREAAWASSETRRDLVMFLAMAGLGKITNEACHRQQTTIFIKLNDGKEAEWEKAAAYLEKEFKLVVYPYE